MAQESWQARLTRTMAGQVRRYRTRLKLSAQALSDRCEQLGFPIPRPVLSNLENGRRDSVSVAELLVLAAALEVPPLLLVVPLGEPETVEILPGMKLSTWDVARWWEGRAVMRAAGDTAFLGPDEDPYEELVLHLERAHAQMVLMIRSAGTTFHQASAAIAKLLGEDEPGTAALLSTMNEGFRTQINNLVELRKTMRAEGLIPPPLPPGLEFVDGDPTKAGAEVTA